MQVPLEIRLRGVRAVEIYEQCIAGGESHRLAEMLAMRQAPRTSGTDTTFFSGIGSLEQQFGSDPEGRSQLAAYVNNARKHGYNPNPNDYYVGAIADFPGDPKAFVGAKDGLSHVRKVLEDKGMGTLDGSAIKVKARGPESDPYENASKKKRKEQNGSD